MATHEGRSFVFYDPTGRRWAVFRRGAQSAAVVLGLGIALFVLVMFTGTQLPVLGLPAVAPIGQLGDVPAIIRGQKGQKNVPYRIPKPANIHYVRSSSPVLHPRSAAKAASGGPLVWAFYVNWDPGSIVSLRLHLSHITHLVPEWLTLANGKGDVSDETDQTVLAIAHQANFHLAAVKFSFADNAKTFVVEGSPSSKSIFSTQDREPIIELNMSAHM